MPFPTLKTERLLLRSAESNDAAQLLDLRKSELAMRYIPRPRAQSLADIDALLEVLANGAADGKAINWGICTISRPKLIIGMIGFVSFCHHRKVAEIGYMLHPNYWGKGYIMEAIVEIERYGFNEINLSAIEAKIDPRNENSKKILLRNSYLFDRFVQKEMEFQGEELNTEYYIKYK